MELLPVNQLSVNVQVLSFGVEKYIDVLQRIDVIDKVHPRTFSKQTGSMNDLIFNNLERVVVVSVADAVLLIFDSLGRDLQKAFILFLFLVAKVAELIKLLLIKMFSNRPVGQLKLAGLVANWVIVEIEMQTELNIE